MNIDMEHQQMEMTHPVALILMNSKYWRYKQVQLHIQFYNNREGFKLWHYLDDTPYTQGEVLLNNCNSADDMKQGREAFRIKDSDNEHDKDPN